MRKKYFEAYSAIEARFDVESNIVNLLSHAEEELPGHTDEEILDGIKQAIFEFNEVKKVK